MESCKKVAASLKSCEPWGNRASWTNAVGPGWKLSFAVEPWTKGFSASCAAPYSAGATEHQLSLDEKVDNSTVASGFDGKWRQHAADKRLLREQKNALAVAALCSLSLGPPVHKSTTVSKLAVEELDIGHAFKERQARKQRSWSRLNVSELSGPILNENNPDARCLCWMLLVLVPPGMESQTNSFVSKWLLRKLMGYGTGYIGLVVSSAGLSIWTEWISFPNACCLSVVRASDQQVIDNDIWSCFGQYDMAAVGPSFLYLAPALAIINSQEFFGINDNVDKSSGDELHLLLLISAFDGTKDIMEALSNKHTNLANELENSEEVPFPGHLTSKSNVCSFRVVLLELMIGRRSMDKSRSAGLPPEVSFMLDLWYEETLLRYYAPALGFLMFAVGVNSSAKDLIETIKRPDAIAAGYIRQFVKLVTVDDPFITTDYMVSGGSTGSWPGSPSRNVGKIDEASELRRTVSDIKHNVQTQLSENAKTNKRVIGIHKELQKLHREAIQNTINSVTMVATLIASIAFVVIFNLPGQYFQDVNSGGDIGEAQTTMVYYC
ncbi:hypothetical protein ZEAMMB73_Zm00001d022000 [Zea mays]|uniref:PGG domain-containing protein n=1 Tax=Zea mays TaxID=4577 RepID=A0A1D6IID0_MAIZE|nr:hypothetical protein ZEAMMB73_Zm00001d022000 [Zea mays]ONM59290.1 hypothetical protein ZEAMMB73_Zm00001d022000 [Zea mays]